MDVPFWLIDTATVGGLVVVVALGTALLIYFFMLRWIVQGAQEDED